MCGIAGILNLDGRPVERAELERLGKALAHRGPDGDGFHIEGTVGLAHRRLAIIDPKAGQQPFLTPDGSLALSYNGEIYNYLELRRELEGEFPFTTDCDTEVLVRAYQKWGISCLERFRGMFAFALLDRNAQRLFLVRDRVGIKPLYYFQTPQRIAFASELGALTKAGLSREVDPAGVSDYFRLQYLPAPATIYRSAHKVAPGHYLEIDVRSGAITDREYWRLVIRQVDRSEADARAELDALLDDTLRIYVRSDVPFGAFLSGGVDSSLVTALMARQMSEPVRTFSIGFVEKEHSELAYAAEASSRVKTRHHERTVTVELAEEILASIASHFGEPFGDSSAIPTWYVCREAASQVKMVLSGDGGDELFAGYDSYQSTYRQSTGPRGLLRRALRQTAGAAVSRWADARALSRLQASHDAQREAFTHPELEEFLVPGVVSNLSAGAEIDEDIDPVTLFQAQDFKTYLVDDVLTKVDRMSMAHSLEVRVPLLDHKLVEFAFSLPLDLKIQRSASGLETKVLLRHSAERFFPREFLARPKRGFGIPIVEWCRGPLRPLLERIVSTKANPVFEWVRPESAGALLRDFLGGDDAVVARVWYLLMFDCWVRHVHRAA